MNWNLHTAYRCYFPIALAAIISSCATPLELPTASSTRPDRVEALASSAGSGSQAGGTGFSLKGGFYPLQLGNHWLFRKQFVVAVIPNQGDPSPPYEEEATIDRQLVCVERRDGRDYMVEQAEEQGPYQTFRSWIRYRQDRTGLYEADVYISDPPPCATATVSPPDGRGSGTAVDLDSRVAELDPAGTPARRAAFQAAARRLSARLAIMDGVLQRMGAPPAQTSGAGMAGAGELTRLSYPLHPGAHWIIRNDPGATFSANVEAADVLDLRVGRLRGYRIRISTEFLGPADVVHVWYGPSGYLQLVAHFETDAVDEFGEVVGRAVVDQRETLVFLQLAGPTFTFVPIGSRLWNR